MGYFLSRNFFFVDTDFVSRMCQSYSGSAMARIYLLSILAASVLSKDNSDDEDYIVTEETRGKMSFHGKVRCQLK